MRLRLPGAARAASARDCVERLLDRDLAGTTDSSSLLSENSSSPSSPLTNASSSSLATSRRYVAMCATMTVRSTVQLLPARFA